MQACMPKCWDNSRYVSPCTTLHETLCLCEDARFQNVGRLFIRDTLPPFSFVTDHPSKVVFQCLYSQCPTTQFGSALHHSLSACRDYDAGTLNALPPLVRHQGLRKRGIQTTGMVSGRVSTSATHSVARRSVSASVVHSARITKSVGSLPTLKPRALSSDALLAPLGTEDTDTTIIQD